MDWVVFGLSTVFGAAVGALAAYWLVAWRRSVVIHEVSVMVDNHEHRLFSVEQTLRSAKGVAAREEIDAETQAFMAEVMTMMQSGGLDMGKLAGLAAKHPKAAQKALKQLGLKL